MAFDVHAESADGTAAICIDDASIYEALYRYVTHRFTKIYADMFILNSTQATFENCGLRLGTQELRSETVNLRLNI